MDGSANAMGGVPAAGRDDTDGGTDSEYLDGQGSSDHLWTGVYSDPSEITVYDLGGVTTGETGLCASGSYTGAVCGLKVGTVINRCFTAASGKITYLTSESNWSDETNEHVCDEIDISNPDGNAWAGDGDSGGPVYTVVSGDVYALGDINYGDVEATCNSGQNPMDGNRGCFSSGDYVSLNAVLQAYPGNCLTDTVACLYCASTGDSSRCTTSP
jgi:hypothetical protein